MFYGRGAQLSNTLSVVLLTCCYHEASVPQTTMALRGLFATNALQAAARHTFCSPSRSRRNFRAWDACPKEIAATNTPLLLQEVRRIGLACRQRRSGHP